MICPLIRLVICSLFILSCSIAYTQAPKFSNEFLNIGAGAKSHAMGGAMAAHVDDVTAMYWNPAGLADVRASFQVSAMHAEWFAGLGKLDYLALGKPVKFNTVRAVLGISAVRFGVDNIPNTLSLVDSDGSLNYNNVTPFSAADYAFSLNYAQKLYVKGLQIGGGVKVVHRVAGTFATSWGFGADLGMQYKRENWRFGLVAHDITTTFNSWTFSFTEEEKAILELENNVIPASSTELTSPKITLGLGYLAKFTDKLHLLTALDIDFTTDGQRNTLISSKAFNVDPKIGAELSYANFVALRAGLHNVQKTLDDINGEKTVITFQPNVGIGIQIPQNSRFPGEKRYVYLDYAYTDLGDASLGLYSHLASLTIDLEVRRRGKRTQKTNPPQEEQKEPKRPKTIIEQIN